MNSEENELRAQVRRTVDAFAELETFKIYQRLRSEIAESAELADLDDRIRQGKKRIKELRDRPAELRLLLAELKKLEQQHDQHPLIVNLAVYKAQLAELTEPLIHLFEE